MDNRQLGEDRKKKIQERKIERKRDGEQQRWKERQVDSKTGR